MKEHLQLVCSSSLVVVCRYQTPTSMNDTQPLFVLFSCAVRPYFQPVVSEERYVDCVLSLPCTYIGDSAFGRQTGDNMRVHANFFFSPSQSRQRSLISLHPHTGEHTDAGYKYRHNAPAPSPVMMPENDWAYFNNGLPNLVSGFARRI